MYATLPNGIKTFYREAGPPSAPVVLLLHGFPSSSFQYRNLIPLLAEKSYHVIAPDLPGFGFTEIPASLEYQHTFANLTSTISSFLDVLQISKFSVYIFDYGAPTALRLALQRPSAVTAIISQNGNAYLDGLGEFWAPLQAYWKSGSEADREALRPFVAGYAGTLWQYTEGNPHAETLLDPAAPFLDWSLMQQPGNQDIQLDLFRDYATNLDLYPEFQAYFRTSQVPLLAIWGKNDQIFIAPGAEAFKRDLPDAEVKLIDAGHFALESNLREIADAMLAFLHKNGI